MNTYIISDTHWNHDEVISIFNRPENYGIRIVRSWNSCVTKNDLVIHLGDVIWDRVTELKGILEPLNGRKILVRGNHDKKSEKWYMENGFDFVCQSMVYKNILFSHMPMIIPEGAEYNVFGHYHNAPMERWGYKRLNILTPKHILFSLEDNEYIPSNLDRFLKLNKRDLSAEFKEFSLKNPEKLTEMKKKTEANIGFEKNKTIVDYIVSSDKELIDWLAQEDDS